MLRRRRRDQDPAQRGEAAVLSGATWARVVGITVVALSAVANFLFIPYYPLWSLLVIALDVLAIWALAAYAHRPAA